MIKFEDDGPSFLENSQQTVDLAEMAMPPVGGIYSLAGVTTPVTVDLAKIANADSAGYNSSFGYFFVDGSGNPISGEVLWDNVKQEDGQTDGFTIDPADVPAGAVGFGFFIIPNGNSANAGLDDDTPVVFKQLGLPGSPTWSAVIEGDPNTDADDIVLNGSGAPVFFSKADLNPDSGTDHEVDNQLPGNSNWEDLLVPSGDGDYNDVNLNIVVHGAPCGIVNGALSFDGGSDGAASLKLLTEVSDVTSAGDDVTATVNGDGTQIVGTTADGSVVYVITLDNINLTAGTADYEFVQYRQIDHTGTEDATLPVKFSVELTDGDLDTVTTDIVINITDSVPTADAAVVRFDETPGNQGQDERTAPVDTISKATKPLSFNFGKDHIDAKITLTDKDGNEFDGAPSDLTDTATGQIIYLYTLGDKVIGRVGESGAADDDGAIAFEASLDQLGTADAADFVFLQFRAFEHTNTNNHNEQTSMDEIHYVVTDGDGDESAPAKITVQVRDDGPSIDLATTGTDPVVTVDETDLGVASAGTSFAGRFSVNAGTDGEKSVDYDLVVSAEGADSGLDTTAGESILLYTTATGVEGRVGSETGAVAFSVSVDASGNVTLVQNIAMDHPIEGVSHDEPIFLGDGVLDLKATVTDGDNDTASENLDLGGNLSFKDDGPSIVLAATGTDPVVTVDETDLGVASTAISFANRFSVDAGEDGEQSVDYDLVVSAEGADSGLDTTAGLNILLFTAPSGAVEGRVGGIGGAVAFSVSVDGSGNVTLVQNLSMDHPIEGTSHDEPIFLADGVLDLKATVTDGDNDTASESIDLGGNLSFEDDGPDADYTWNSSTDLKEDDLHQNGTEKVSGTLSGDFGSDGAGTYALTGFESTLADGAEHVSGSFTSNGEPVVFDGPAFNAVTNLWTMNGTAATGVAGASEDVIQVTVNATTGVYEIELLGPVDQDDIDQIGSADEVGIWFNFTMTDADGDVSSNRLHVHIQDDGPVVTISDATSVAEGADVTGAWAHDFGLDGAADMGSVVILVDGVATTAAVGDDITIAGKGVLNISATGWTFTANDGVDHSSGNPVVSFAIKVTDGDGDTKTATEQFFITPVVTPPTVVITNDDDLIVDGHQIVIKEDTSETVSATVQTTGDDVVNVVTVTGLNGLGAGYVVTINGTPVTVDGSGVATLDVYNSGAGASTQSIVVTVAVSPDAQSDVDLGTIVVSATAIDPGSNLTSASTSDDITVVVDAVADAASSVAGSVIDTTVDPDTNALENSSVTVDLSAMLADVTDSSEGHSFLVEVSGPFAAPTGVVPITITAGFDGTGVAYPGVPDGDYILVNAATAADAVTVDSGTGTGSVTLDIGNVTDDAAVDYPVNVYSVSRETTDGVGDLEGDFTDNVAIKAGSFTVTLKDSVPEITDFVISDDLVLESGLSPDGSSPSPSALEANGSFDVETGQDTVKAVEVYDNDSTSWVEITDGLVVDSPLGSIEFSIETDGSYSWTYTLDTASSNHTDTTKVGSADTITETFSVRVTDSDDDISTPKDIIIRIGDDGPLAVGETDYVKEDVASNTGFEATVLGEVQDQESNGITNGGAPQDIDRDALFFNEGTGNGEVMVSGKYAKGNADGSSTAQDGYELELRDGEVITIDATGAGNTAGLVVQFYTFESGAFVLQTTGSSYTAVGDGPVYVKLYNPVSLGDYDVLLSVTPVAADAVYEATGNVFSGVDVVDGDSNATDGNADTAGADGFDKVVWSPSNVYTSPYGTLTVDDNGDYSFALDNDSAVVQQMIEGDNVDLTFDYNVVDNDGDTSNEATLTINIKGTNDGVTITDLTPKAGGGEGTLNENDLSPDGSDTTPESTVVIGDFKITAPDGLGTVVIDGVEVITGTTVNPGVTVVTPAGILTITAYDPSTGVVQYTYELTNATDHPSGGGTNSQYDDLSVIVTDRDGDDATGTLSIKIIDDVPTAVDDVVIGDVPEDSSVIIDVFGNDTAGADGVSLTTGVALTDAASKGTVTYNNDGTFTYQANAGEEGSDSFTYTITDSDGDTSKATVTLNIATDSTPTVTSTSDTALVDEGGLDDVPNTDTSEEDTGSFTVDYDNDVPTTSGGVVLKDTLALDSELTTLDGTPITFGLDAGGNLVGSAGGIDYIEIALTTTSAATTGGEVTYGYKVTLLDEVKHAVSGEDTNVLNGVSFTATDSDGDPIVGSFDVNIKDDVPTANADIDCVKVEVAEPTPQNIGIVMDFSGSVDNGELDDQIEAVKSFAQSLFFSNTDVTISIVAFDDAAGTVGVFTDLAALVAAIDLAKDRSFSDPDGNYTGGDTTGYEYGIEELFDKSGGAGYTEQLGAHNEVYFLSDGNRNTGATTLANVIGQSGNAGTDLDKLGNEITLTGVTIGNSAIGTSFNNFFGPTIVDLISTPSFVALGDTLNGTVSTTEVTGNVLTGIDITPGGDANTDDGVADTFGADGFGSFAWDPSRLVGDQIVGKYGTLTANADGSYTYLLDNTHPDVVVLDEGETLTDETFSYTITDGDGDPSETTLTITVKGAEDAPTVTPLSELMLEDTSISFTAAQLLVGASDIDGDTLSVENVTVNNGTLVEEPTGTWTYTPDTHSDVDATVSFDVSDGTVSVLNTMAIEVLAVADAPTLLMSVGAGSAKLATGTNLIVNGSFEDISGIDQNGATVPDSNISSGGLVHRESMTGWDLTVTDGTMPDMEPHHKGHAGVGSTDGDNYMDLGASPGNSSIIQTITGLVGGTGYKISVDYRDKAAMQESGQDGIDSGVMQIIWNGQVIAAIQGNNTTGWLNETIIVSAVAGSNTLEFNEIGVNDDNWGIAIDDVQLFELVAPYEYDLTLSAALVDTDGSESLGLVTVLGSSLPSGVTISGYTPDGSGNYEIDATAPVTVSLVSANPLTEAQLNGITGSVTSTETDGADTATTTETARIEFDGIDGSAETADLLIEGTAADATLKGGSGDDIIIGGTGMETLVGNAGDDILLGGLGDTLTGGTGSDIFVVTEDTSSNVVTITDFDVVGTPGGDEDILDLSDVLSDLGAHAASDLSIVFDGTDTASVMIGTSEVATIEGLGLGAGDQVRVIDETDTEILLTVI